MEIKGIKRSIANFIKTSNKDTEYEQNPANFFLQQIKQSDSDHYQKNKELTKAINYFVKNNLQTEILLIYEYLQHNKNPYQTVKAIQLLNKEKISPTRKILELLKLSENPCEASKAIVYLQNSRVYPTDKILKILKISHQPYMLAKAIVYMYEKNVHDVENTIKLAHLANSDQPLKFAKAITILDKDPIKLTRDCYGIKTHVNLDALLSCLTHNQNKSPKKIAKIMVLLAQHNIQLKMPVLDILKKAKSLSFAAKLIIDKASTKRL